MQFPDLKNDRFVPEQGAVVSVQVPEMHGQDIIDAVLSQVDLKYGDYDRVCFRSAPGVQMFRSLGQGRNAATEAAVEVPCVELSFFLNVDQEGLIALLQRIYAQHPYEEPVIFVSPCIRTLHIRGLDEDNPNRFWNRDSADWVPEAHR